MFGELGACNLAVSRIAAPVMMLNNVTGISAGARHTCALRATGEVSCWGDDESGQLGNSAMARTQMCPVGVTGLTDVVQIAAGGEHTCALQASGAVSCWGAGTVGQLGRGSTEGSAVPVAVAGTINAVAIDAGGGHTCAVRGSGEVVCWGSNRSGQVGSASESNLTTPFAVADLTDVVQVSLGQEHSCALRRSGRVVCWGRGEGGQLGDGMATNRSAANVDVVGLVDAAEISMGDNHGCARRATGAVVCWGAGASGQLGNGTTTASQRSPVIVMGLTDATELAGGAEHHCARSASRGVVCWGNNMGGQLGNNSVADSAIPVQVMGL